MAREPLEQLLATVTDEELENLRDSILREEGRRRVQFDLVIKAPFPPLALAEDDDVTVTRWAKLITWLAKEMDFPPAERKRGVSIQLFYAKTEKPDVQDASILLQQALVEARMLVGRTPEWMDATATQAEFGESDTVHIQMWDKPVAVPWA